MRDFMDSTSKIEAERDDYLAKSHSLEADLKKLKNEHKKLRDIFKAMKKKTKESTPNVSKTFSQNYFSTFLSIP
jgi:prefoldin subunit 5